MADQWSPLKEGDILAGNMSRTAVRPYWYQVIAASSRYVTIKRINEKILTGDGMIGTAICIPNDFLGGAMTLQVRSQENPPTRASVYVVHNGFTLKLWTGQPLPFRY